jgi:hypothetical protein
VSGIYEDAYENAYYETAEQMAQVEYETQIETLMEKTGFDWNRCARILSALTDCDSADSIADLTTLIDALTDLRDGLLEEGAEMEDAS